MFTRLECLERLRKVVKEGRPIIVSGAGTGLSAKCAEAGGADLIAIYNSGRFRMAGCGSLAGLMPYGDANAIVMEMGREALPIVKNTPVLAGVCGTDPFRLKDVFLKELKAAGFSGVQNFPTVGLCDGVFRANLEETGMGYDQEVEMIARARKLDMLTTPYVFNAHDALKMAEAGADALVAHMGLTTKGLIGAKSAMTLDQAAELAQRIADVGKSVNPEILVLCHGGPIAEPEDLAYIFKHSRGIHGFFGASSIERLPTEVAITSQVEQFKKISATRGLEIEASR
jgi:predicted TIM-barrel enzyme